MRPALWNEGGAECPEARRPGDQLEGRGGSARHRRWRRGTGGGADRRRQAGQPAHQRESGRGIGRVWGRLAARDYGSGLFLTQYLINKYLLQE